MPRLLHHISARYHVARGQIRKCGENQRNADQTPVLGFRDLRF